MKIVRVILALAFLFSVFMNAMSFSAFLMLLDRTDDLAASMRACGRVQRVQTERLVDVASTINLLAKRDVFVWDEVR